MLFGPTEMIITKETLKEALQFYFNEHVFAKDRAPIIDAIKVNSIEYEKFAVETSARA